MCDKMNNRKENKGELFMTTTIQKWGNSLGVRIPQSIAKKHNVMNGSQVRLSEDGKRIIIEPVKDEPTLDELLARCVGDNPHDEFFSDSVGREEI